MPKQQNLSWSIMVATGAIANVQWYNKREIIIALKREEAVL